jgi:putative endonuclease
LPWSVYIIETSAGTLYTGVSTDVARRFREHHGGRRGARYFRGAKPRAVVFVEDGHTRSSACRREAAIKRLSREGKLALIATLRVPAGGVPAEAGPTNHASG